MRVGDGRLGATAVIADRAGLGPGALRPDGERPIRRVPRDRAACSRLNDKLSGAIVLIMHRLHEDDLPGHVLAQEKWEVVRLSAIAEEDEWHRVETVFGRQSFRRKAGEVLHPVREPPEMLGPLRRTLGEYNFAARYQQAPSPRNTMDEASNWVLNATRRIPIPK